ncbi:MAG: hypothetical protein R3208_22875, partial [Ketobacteraceae bacterium]|nr:hypothetical protein [Ketobacteraceae bacterium]
MPTRLHNIAALLWAVMILALALWAGSRLLSGNAIDANMLNLLPGSERQALPDTAIKALGESQSGKIVIVVSHPQLDTAVAGVRRLQGMTGSLVTPQLGTARDVMENIKGLAPLYQPHARRLLTDEDFQLLQNGDYDVLVAKARETLYSPVTAVSSSLLASDPL